jgi:signal peptidase I
VAAWLAALAWLILTLSSASIWAAGVSTLVALAVWTAELLDTRWCIVRSPAEGLLARRFGFVTILVWGVCLILTMFAFLSFRLMRFGDDKMVPAVEPGELLIFHRRVVDADLKQGTVIAFRLPPHARVEEWSGPVIARILAGPDDELTIRDGRYVVNGEVSRYRPGRSDPKAPLRVPLYPRKLIVPEARYFVVQESPDTGVDSQALDYVRRIDVVSARLFHFGRRGLMRMSAVE